MPFFKKKKEETKIERSSVEQKPPKAIAKKDDQKGPTTEKLDALSSALPKLQQKAKDAAPLVVPTVAPQQLVQTPHRAEESTVATPPEIPLDVLKNILADNKENT